MQCDGKSSPLTENNAFSNVNPTLPILLLELSIKPLLDILLNSLIKL